MQLSLPLIDYDIIFAETDTGVSLSVHLGSTLTYIIPTYVASCDCHASSFANSVSESYMTLASGQYIIEPP